MAEFVIHVPDIDEAGKDYDFPVRTAWLAEVLAGTDVKVAGETPDGHLTFRAHRQGVDVVLHGRVQSTLLVECARCLGPASVGIEAEVGALMTARGPSLRPEPDELELTPEDLSREFFTGDKIELDEFVREHLLLELPLKPLCAEDCAGIAPQAARANGGPTIDPRLAPLLKLVGKVPTQE